MQKHFLSYCLSWFYLWGGLMDDQATRANLSPAIHCRLLNKTRENLELCSYSECICSLSALHSSKQLLSVCIFLYSWQTRVTAVPKVVVTFFSLHSWAKGLSVYPRCFLRASKSQDCQRALCNRCNLRGGVARGRREVSAAVGRLVQIDTLHTRTACQTDKVPSSVLNQMWPSDSCEEPEQRSAEAVCCYAEWLGCLHSNGCPESV